MRQANHLYSEGQSFALAMYCGGLAVECLLRAFRFAEDDSFEGRHDLIALLRASRFLRVNEVYSLAKGVSRQELEQVGLELPAINEVASLSRNNLRFASETSLKAYLNRIERVRGIKGNPLKKNTLELLDAAQTVIDRGVAIWTSGEKS